MYEGGSKPDNVIVFLIAQTKSFQAGEFVYPLSKNNTRIPYIIQKNIRMQISLQSFFSGSQALGSTPLTNCSPSFLSITCNIFVYLIACLLSDYATCLEFSIADQRMHKLSHVNPVASCYLIEL